MSAQTLTRLRELKLTGMASALEHQQQQFSTVEGLSFTERLEPLLDRESAVRDNRKQDRLIHQAQFKLSASINQIDYGHSRNLEKSVISRLAQCDWIERHQYLLITGPCGSGKTYPCVCGRSCRRSTRI